MEHAIIAAGEKNPKIYVIAEKVRMILSRTKATVASGTPVLYDSGRYYDDGTYYDRWVSDDGVIAQAEEPKTTTKQETVIINSNEEIPKIKVKYHA